MERARVPELMVRGSGSDHATATIVYYYRRPAFAERCWAAVRAMDRGGVTWLLIAGTLVKGG